MEKVHEAYYELRNNFSANAKTMINEIYSVDLNSALDKTKAETLSNDLLFQKDKNDVDTTRDYWYFNGDFTTNPKFDLKPLEKLLERTDYFRDNIVAQGLGDEFNQVYGENIEFSHLTPEDLEFFTTILYDQNGKIKSEGDIDEFLEFLPTVSTIMQAIKNGDISTAAFINWTKGRDFAISSLPSSLSLNPQLDKSYQDYENLSDALFSLASLMNDFLDKARSHSMNLPAFNTVYGLHSLENDYQLHSADTELAGVLFMVVSDPKTGDIFAYTRSIPHLAQMIEEIQTHPEYVQALRHFYSLNIPLDPSFSLNPKTREQLGEAEFSRIGQKLFEIAGFIDQSKGLARPVSRWLISILSAWPSLTAS